MNKWRNESITIGAARWIAAVGLTLTLVAAEQSAQAQDTSLAMIATTSSSMATRGGGPTLELATISTGGAVLPDGSIVILGQPFVGTASSKDFTIEMGLVPILDAASSCPASTTPVADLIGEDISSKNRFLSFSAGDADQSQAVRVTFDALPAPFDLWNGAELWVGPTSQVAEAGAVVVPTGGATFTAATLQCEPFFTDWSSLGMVHVFHEGIVPDGAYRVDVIDETSDAGVATSFSGALPLTTPIWGDTVLNLADTPPLPPNGPPVDIVDALGVLGAFSSAPGAIIKARADLEPACVDLTINVTDVLSSLAGFAGLFYPFTTTAADPCDSTCMNPLP